MHEHGPGGAMEQAIFRQGLSTESTSLYLLACGILDADQSVTRKNMADRWNGTEEDLENALNDLLKRRIIQQILSDGQGGEAYRILGPEHWRAG